MSHKPVSDLKIAVLGTGANGAGIAADLVHAGLNVTLIDQWPDNVDAMRKNGLKVEFASRTEQTEVNILHLCQLAELRSKFDAVLLLVKAYDTRWACELIKPYLAEDGFVVGVQNGMSHLEILDVLGAHRALGAVIEITAAMDTPGVVSRHSDHDKSWFAVGAVKPEAAHHVETAAEILRHSGVVEITDDISSRKWMKLVLNAAELVPSAILNLSIVECAKFPGMRQYMLAAGNEAIHAAEVMGLEIRPIFGMSGEAAESPSTYVAAVLDELLSGYVLPHSKSTVLQDWNKGRRAEIEEINGAVVVELAKAGIEAPVNQAVLKFARQIEAGNLTASIEVFELLKAELAK